MSEDNIVNLRRKKSADEIYVGFGIFARLKSSDKLLSLRVLKPTHEGGDFELLLDRKTFRRLKKIAKKYWRGTDNRI